MPVAAPTVSPRTFALVGSTLNVLVSAEETGGQFALVSLDLVPLDPGPPVHTHTREDETFYVLDGPIVFTEEGVERTFHAGECFFAARGRRHKFRNPQNKPARLLVYFNPAAHDGFYGYIHAVAEKGAPTGPPTDAHIKAVLDNGPKFGIHFHL